MRKGKGGVGKYNRHGTTLKRQNTINLFLEDLLRGNDGKTRQVCFFSSMV